MTIRKARRAQARALVVPLLMSAAMWLVIAELALGWCDPILQLGRLGPAAACLVILVMTATAADTQAGERWWAHVLLLARAPRLHQRHTLAPVAQALLRHGVPPQQLLLLVGPGRQPVKAFGRRTIVVSRRLVEDIRHGQLGPDQAAAVIAHEVGVQRSGLARHDPAMMILLAPWRLWITWIGIMWGIAAAFLSHRLMVASLVIQAGVGIWLGFTENPFLFVTTVVMTVVLTTWWSFRSWSRARAQVGDDYLLKAGLAEVYADLLTANFTDDYTRDRAVRLRYPQAPPATAVHPNASQDLTPQQAVALLGSGRSP